MVGLLTEIERAVALARADRPFHFVDAAAGKAYVGLLAAEFFLASRPSRSHVTLIERERERAGACRRAVALVHASRVDFTVTESDVADASAWPDGPDLVVALHACGPAADAIAERAVACRTRHLLLVPCCTSMRRGRHGPGDPAGGGAWATPPRRGPAPVRPGHRRCRTHATPGVRWIRDRGRPLCSADAHTAQPTLARAPRWRTGSHGRGCAKTSAITHLLTPAKKAL